jgi:hypothetical protein
VTVWAWPWCAPAPGTFRAAPATQSQFHRLVANTPVSGIKFDFHSIRAVLRVLTRKWLTGLGSVTALGWAVAGLITISTIIAEPLWFLIPTGEFYHFALQSAH